MSQTHSSAGIPPVDPRRARVEIRPATVDDVSLVLRFIRELAEYEKLADQVVATEEGLRHTLFGPAPKAEVVFAMVEGEEAGFALFFHHSGGLAGGEFASDR